MRACVWIVIGLQVVGALVNIGKGLVGGELESQEYNASNVLYGCILFALAGFAAYAVWFRL